ncbi:3-methyladenine DNA glycosylase [Mycolicibacterium rhodesiae]|uniref:3-methyladenine DNA glycosylase n=1 Tax=Mycolicibacterium rhodesiae TaxID=36814 RepID=A0A1X0IVD4_MYCRH|nr:3-methyladenine DNA glycosylase [Mycolicibacterium rhodesiae]MCV7343471.1 3-methyladenine DNA glycosylase [Mycolicibacterium rhodesiae]ORB52923.1 3-methyladenine DNA glycosylase [Mycolicibacterium rhodesiae]
MPHRLREAEWTARAASYRRRIDSFTAPHLERARRGEAHPVWDFLFTYYSLRPRQLRVWHPGYGTSLAGAAASEYLDRAGYQATPDGVTVGAGFLHSRLSTVGFVADLLRSTAARPPQFGCFGLHEWAMVYRADTVRHGTVPLRLGGAGTDAVVESIPLRCTHFDAYRFFTAAAAPRNRGVPTRAAQRDWEQPGCLHANMDLYKWCFKLGPLVNSELLVDCLELAADARELDMRASPYDLSGFGFEPITVEEPAGRAEYVRCQGVIAERAAPLRAELLAWCERLLGAEVAYDTLSEGFLPAGKMN